MLNLNRNIDEISKQQQNTNLILMYLTRRKVETLYLDDLSKEQMVYLTSRKVVALYLDELSKDQKSSNFTS